MKGYKRNRLSRYVLAALTVGMFSLVPVAYALPVADTGYTNTSGSAINTSVANQLGITSTVANNVMNWKTFSIANGEKVQFDTNNYLNLVRGASKSEIDGTLSGGGNIYLINPNGILFGTNARVNVGNLVASTRAITDADQTTFLDGGNPITTNTASSAAGDIINLGKLQTTKLVLEGNNITIQNAADITSDGSAPLTSAVTAKAAGIITVGHKVTETTTRSFTINGTATDKPVHDYKNATVANSGYTGKKLDGTTDNAIKEAMLVDNVYDLQNMDAKLDGNYMLAGDIDASDTSTWNAGDGFGPVGNFTSDDVNNPFTGTFDGAMHTISNLNIKRTSTNYVGLFGYTATGSILQNVGLVDGSITGRGFVGSVAGSARSTITNVYNTGTVSGSSVVGGVVGADAGTISNVYNTGIVSGTDNTGGVVGAAFGTINNVYNTGAVSGKDVIGGVIGYASSSSIENAYNTGTVNSTGSNVGGVVGVLYGDTLSYAYNTGAVSATGDKLYPSNTGGVVGNNSGTITNVYNIGAVSATSSNVGGVVGTSYNNKISYALWANDLTYTPAEGQNKPTQAVGDRTDTATTVNGVALADMKKAATYSGWQRISSTYGADNVWRIYDGYTTPLLTSLFKNTVTVMNKQTTTYNRTSQSADKSAAVYDSTVDTSHIYAGSGTNAGTYDLFYSDQQGYNLVNDNNFVINPITLTATINAPASTFTKEYDGNTSVRQDLGSYYTLDTSSVISGDVIEGLDTTKASGVYDTKNVGDNKTINFSSITLTGADAGNYTIASTLSGNVGQITQKNITAALTGTNSITKVYDGDNKVTAALTRGTNYQFTGMVDKDDLKLTGTGKYNDKNAGNGKAVSFTGLGLTGDDAGNYNLTTEALIGNVGKIDQKTIAVEIKSGYTFAKEYDGTDIITTVLAKDTNYVLNDVVSGDDLSLNASKASGTYTDGKNAGDNLNTKFIGLELTGADKDNYALKDDTMDGNYGKITPKTLMATLVGDNVFTKVYDGTTAVSQALTQGTNYTLDGIVADSDKVSLVGSGVYNDKNAGDNKAITFSGLTLTGTGAGNYTIASTLSGAVGQITKKSLVAEMNNGASFTKVYDGTTAVNTALVLDSNYAFAEGDVVTGDAVSIDAAKAVGAYDSKDVGSNKQVNFTNLALTGADAGNYELLDIEMGITGAGITPKALTATVTGDNVFTKVYDGTTAVSQALGTNYTLDGIVADSDKVSLSAGSGAYNDKNVGNSKTITFSGLTLTGTGAGNYTIASTMSGAVGQITRKTITGSLASGYSFDKVYDGTTTASLGNGYTLNGVAAGDKVPLTAAKGFYDSSAIGDRTVTFSGFSINDGNYLLSMADSLSGTGKITSGSQDHNYSDALTGVSSFFGANPSDGYTIFSGSPEDYVPRAVTKNNGQSYQVGVSQVTQTWYNGPATITIINGGITLPKDILLGSTPDTRTVVIKGGTSN